MLVSFSMERVDFLLFISVLDRHKGENSCWKLRAKYSDNIHFTATVIASIYDKTIDIWTAFIVSLEL